MPGCKSKIETILSGDGDEKAKLEAIKTCLESEPDDDDVEKSPLDDEEDKPALEAEGDEPEPEDEEDEDKKPGGFKTESILTRGLSRKLESLKKEVRRTKKEAWLRNLCESVKLTADRSLFSDLMSMPKEVAERNVRRLALSGSKPRSGSFTESAGMGLSTPAELANFLIN